MKIVTVASTNPVKLNAVQSALFKIFPGETFDVRGMSVSSGVSDQPMGDDETYRGAVNRVEATKLATPESDYWAAIEGGCGVWNDKIECFAWIVIRSREGVEGVARTASFHLPRVMTDLIKQGMELGKVDDLITGRINSKQQNGTVGFLTGDAIDRSSYYEHAVMLALIPFKNSELYRPK